MVQRESSVQKFQRKKLCTPGNSADLCDAPWKYEGQKPRSMEILHAFFSLEHPEEIPLLF